MQQDQDCAATYKVLTVLFCVQRVCSAYDMPVILQKEDERQQRPRVAKMVHIVKCSFDWEILTDVQNNAEGFCAQAVEGSLSRYTIRVS